MLSKEAIRKELLKKRRNLSDDFIEKSSKTIIKNLQKTKHFENALTIFSYLSYNNEVDTLDLVKNLIGKKTITVPYIKEKSMTMAKLENFADLTMGKYDILVPKTIIEVGPKFIDLVLVPGVVFDNQGNRIGFGGGFYDKILKKIHAPKIGLCYDFQLKFNIPTEIHDQKVDFIITEKRFHKCK